MLDFEVQTKQGKESIFYQTTLSYPILIKLIQNAPYLLIPQNFVQRRMKMKRFNDARGPFSIVYFTNISLYYKSNNYTYLFYKNIYL